MKRGEMWNTLGFVQRADLWTEKCNNAQQTATVQDFTQGVASTNIGPDPQFPDFDLICEA